MQKLLYKELTSRRFDDPLQAIFQKRLTDLFHPYNLDWGNRIGFEDSFRVLKKCSPAVSIKVIKGWCNGWATSRRYHEAVLLPCLFGCPNEQDNLAHYLICPHLFAIWRYLVGDVSDMPLTRWGVDSPCVPCMQQIACVFSGYHAVRRHFKANAELFLPAQLNMTGPQIRAAWTNFADAFTVEACQLSINTRKFSVPTFLSFLNGAPDCLSDCLIAPPPVLPITNRGQVDEPH